MLTCMDYNIRVSYKKNSPHEKLKKGIQKTWIFKMITSAMAVDWDMIFSA
jgi:hypothetical protein